MPHRQPRTRAEADKMLAPLHLVSSVLEIALGKGAVEARGWSGAAPAATPEYARWSRTVEHFQIESTAHQLGWERRNPQNLPLFIHSEIATGIVISSGDENTGVLGFQPPATRNPKGERFISSISPSGQGSFFSLLNDDGDEVSVDDMRVVLYTEHNGFVRCEVSQPLGVKSGRVVSWADRILMPSFDVSANEFAFEEDDDRGDDLDFVISRR